jgi:hypothetical protein
VAVYVEEQLYRKSGSVTGIIFSLKNNFGWKDTFENTNKNIDLNKLLGDIERSNEPLL